MTSFRHANAARSDNVIAGDPLMALSHMAVGLTATSVMSGECERGHLVLGPSSPRRYRKVLFGRRCFAAQCH